MEKSYNLTLLFYIRTNFYQWLAGNVPKQIGDILMLQKLDMMCFYR